MVARIGSRIRLTRIRGKHKLQSGEEPLFPSFSPNGRIIKSVVKEKIQSGISLRKREREREKEEGRKEKTRKRELGCRIYERTMKFRMISRTRHAGRRARSRQVIKQRADGQRRRRVWCGIEGKQERRGEMGRDERRKEAPENSLRRLADFAPRRFPCPVNRKAGYSFRGGGSGAGRMGLSTFPLLYTLHRAYIPRQVDQSCARSLSLSPL